VNAAVGIFLYGLGVVPLAVKGIGSYFAENGKLYGVGGAGRSPYAHLLIKIYIGVKIRRDFIGLFVDDRFFYTGQGKHSGFLFIVTIADDIPVSPLANGVIGVDKAPHISRLLEGPVIKAYGIAGLEDF
jgi:hypothetical protein